jgi:hypothetical protein
MRSLLIGLFAGLTLAALRAPLGLELLQVPALSAGAAAAFRAGALLTVAVGLLLGVRRTDEAFSPLLALAGAALGFPLAALLASGEGSALDSVGTSLLLVTLLVAAHRGRGPGARPDRARILLAGALTLAGWFLLQPAHGMSHARAIGTALVGLFGVAGVGRGTATGADSEEHPEKRPPTGSLFGIALGGAGLAIFAEGIARHLRLLGGGLPEDDTVFGTVFLVLALFGGAAFGRLARGPRATVVVRGLVFALAGLAAWGTFGVLENLATQRGLDLFVRRFGLDLSLQGTLVVDALVAAPVLVLSAFACGTAVAVHRSPQELGALLVGAAGGLVVAPQLLAFELEGGALVGSSSSAALALHGAAIAAGGGLVVFLGTGGLSGAVRLGGALLALGALALAILPDREPIPVLSPWAKAEPVVELVLDAPDGLLTVEVEPGGAPVATLDRRRLTTGAGEARAEERRIDLAWRLLGELEEGAQPAVLLVGQLDPTRALRLADLGAGRVDRTASWHAAMPLLEERLFQGAPGWVAGEVLSPAAARARLAAGEYDLVLVPALEGPPPTTRNLASPPETTVVVWLDGSTGIETQHLGAEALVSAAALRELHVGVARGPRVEELRLTGGLGRPGFLAAGEPVGAVPPLELLGLRRGERQRHLRERLAARLAAAERPPGVAAGLAAHFAAQRRSSPFADPVEGTEISPEGARRFAEAAAGPEPDALAIELVEALAFVLGYQRKIEEIEELLPAPAERHAPWPALEIALGQAALELLEPELALEHLERAHGAVPGTSDSLAMEAEARAQTGDDAGAARCLEAALALDPGRHALERRLAIARVRAGDPRGQGDLREALEEHPEDPELLQHAGPGPYPPAPPGFHPVGRSGHGH